MRIFALGDTHLGFAVDKPMHVFGEHWRNHPEKIARAWEESIGAEDLVLLVGDISWAKRMEEARPDLEFLARLPGRKIMTKGNHDYWWSTTNKVRQAVEPAIVPLLNTARIEGDICIAAARGWNFPQSPDFDADEDPKIYERELERLRSALDAAKRLAGQYRRLMVMMHYPPLMRSPGGDVLSSDFVTAMKDAGVEICVHGHVHGPSLRWVVEGKQDAIEYHCVSADHVDFKPRLILET